MINPIAVELEPDPTLLVRQFGLQFRRAVNARTELASSMKGVFTLVSTTDRRTLTVSINEQRAFIESARRTADVHVLVDFKHPTSARPLLRDMCRHPRLSMKILSLLKPVSIHWERIAPAFWDQVANHPDGPRGLHLVNSDDEHSVVLGAEPIDLTLRGKGEALGNLLSGKTILLYEVLSGAIATRGSLKHLSALSDVGMNLMLGHGSQSREQTL